MQNSNVPSTARGAAKEASAFAAGSPLASSEALGARLRADVVAAVARAHGLREALQRSAEAIVRQVDAAFARIWTVDESAHELVLRASAGLYTHIDGGHARVPIGALKIGSIAESRTPHLTNDVQHDARVGDHAWARREGLVSFAGYPLVLDGRLLGVVALFGRAALDDQTLTDLALTADLLALAIDRDRADAARGAVEAALAQARAVAEAERAAMYATFTQAPAAIAVLRGRPGELVFDLANPSYEQLVGRTGLVGRKGREVLPELVAQGVWDLADSVLVTQQAWSANGLAMKLDRRGDGTLEDGFFSFTVQPMRGDDGTPSGVMVFAIDVTAQRRAEDERARLFAIINEREAQFRALVENLPELAWSAGPDGHIDFYNRRWFEYTGTTFEEMEGWGWEKVHRPDMLGPVVERWKHSIETGAPFEMEFPLRGADGVYRWFLTRVNPLRDEQGRVTRWFGTNTNIEDRKRAESERERLIGALASSNAELDQFAYVASHDLKAPLRGIANLSQWIEEDLGERMTPDSRENMSLLRGRVHRLEQLIDGILTYSRAGRVRDRVEPIDTRALAEEAIELLDVRPPASVVIANALPTVQAERVPLQQVFMNLIGNALKHAGKPEVRVELSAKDTGFEWEFVVHDDGVGIAKEFHDRIWGIFQTLQPRDRVEGTGIGLSVVKKIVDTRGGRVWIESAEGRGAAFHFTWPKQPKLGTEETRS